MKKSKERLHGKVQETLRDVPLSILMKIILSYAFVWDKGFIADKLCIDLE